MVNNLRSFERSELERNAWFRLLTAHRFTEFDTSAIYFQTRTVCKHSVLRLNHEYHIYLCPAFPVRLP